ncbi:E domain-containing protein [Staphylococcus aureus]
MFDQTYQRYQTEKVPGKPGIKNPRHRKK